MSSFGSKRTGSGSACEVDDQQKRRRRGAIIWGRTTVAPTSGGRWAATDVLTTLAVILFLFAATGYANATPLGAVEDSLDALFAEVWDNADDEMIANTAGSMIEMVRAAREDERAFAASRNRRVSGQGLTPDPDITPTPGRTPVSQAGSSLDLGGLVIVPANRAPFRTSTPRATPTETVLPTPTRRVIVSTGPDWPTRPGEEPPPAPPGGGNPPPAIIRQIGTRIATAEPVTSQPVIWPTLMVAPTEPPAATPRSTIVPRQPRRPLRHTLR